LTRDRCPWVFVPIVCVIAPPRILIAGNSRPLSGLDILMRLLAFAEEAIK
jgi:hypothetical protein